MTDKIKQIMQKKDQARIKREDFKFNKGSKKYFE